MGKTSISLKYVNDEFDDQQESTINASYLEKKILLESKQPVKLAIWVLVVLCRTLLARKNTTRSRLFTTGRLWEPLWPTK